MCAAALKVACKSIPLEQGTISVRSEVLRKEKLVVWQASPPSLMWFNFLPSRDYFQEDPPQMAQIPQMRRQKIKTRIIVLSHFFICVLCVICGCVFWGATEDSVLQGPSRS